MYRDIIFFNNGDMIFKHISDISELFLSLLMLCIFDFIRRRLDYKSGFFLQINILEGRAGPRSSSHRCTTFCYGFRVEWHVYWKRCATVCNGVWDTFSLDWWVKNVSPISSNMCINHAVLKRQLLNGSKWSRLQLCPLQLTTIEDIKRHVCRKSFIVT